MSYGFCWWCICFPLIGSFLLGMIGVVFPSFTTKDGRRGGVFKYYFLPSILLLVVGGMMLSPPPGKEEMIKKAYFDLINNKSLRVAEETKSILEKVKSLPRDDRAAVAGALKGLAVLYPKKSEFNKVLEYYRYDILHHRKHNIALAIG